MGINHFGPSLCIQHIQPSLAQSSELMVAAAVVQVNLYVINLLVSSLHVWNQVVRRHPASFVTEGVTLQFNLGFLISDAGGEVELIASSLHLFLLILYDLGHI